MSVRSELADHLGAEISDVVVYDHPAENPSIPSIVMVPRDPYIIPKSFGRGGAPETIGMMLDLALAVHRTSIGDGLTLIETLRGQVSAALGSFIGTNNETVRWESLGGIGTTKVADVDVLTGSIPVAIMATGP